MVKLTLTPHRGNGARTFPATGHLGLSPVTLAGVVRVKIEEDRKTIDASEVLVRVRCYESVGGSSSSSTATSSSASNGGNGSSVNVSSGADTSASSYASTSVADLIKGGSGVPKGNVLYEQSITMWLPPSPPVVPVASTSTSSTRGTSTTASTSSYYSNSEFDSTASSSSRSSTSTSPSPPSPTLTSPPCSRSSSADPHAYPPKPRRRDDDTSSSSQPSVIYGTLGDLQKAFRIVIPPDAVGKGAKSTMIYKTWRIWWAIEAVIAHRPSGIHGDRIVKSHQVALISHASRRSPGPLEWISPSLASTSSDASRSGESSASSAHPPQQQPSISYAITAPAAAFAASDPIAVAVTLTKRYPTAEAPKKIVLELMREITYAQPEPASSGASTQTESSSAAAASTTSAVSPSSSATTITSGRLSSYFSSNRHSRATSNGASHAAPAGLSLNLASSHTFSTSRRRSEALEPLISPPLLTSASTASSSSILPATPPTFVPTPSEQSHSTTDSYFGLFSGSSTASLEPVETLSAASLASAPFPSTSSKKSIPGSSSLAPAATSTSATAGSTARRRREYVTLATFETDCAFTASSNGTTWSGQITGTMPKAKSIYHYALGETCTTQSASSRFYIVPKIYYKSKTHVLELPPRLVAFQTMSTEERRKAKEMLPKTLAVQKAEAKLFGGVEIVAPPDASTSTSESRSKSVSRSTASARQLSPSASPHPRPGLSPAPSTSSMSASARSANIPTQSGSTKSQTSTRESSHRSPGASRSSRMVPSSPSAGNSSEEEMLDLQHFGYPKATEGTSMRRRSEQSASSESLRMRQRFGAAPDLSPVIGSPYIEAVSPSLSVISSSTQRPRSANKRPATGNSSLRSGATALSNSSTARPTSSGGLEPSNASIRSVSSGRFGHITTFADLSNSSLLEPFPRNETQTAPPVLVRLESAKRDDAGDSSMSEDDRDIHHPLQPSVVNGLFADFSGFTLKPPERVDGKVRPLTKNEDRIPPKSITPLKPSSSSSSSKRKNTEGHFTSTGQSPSKTQGSAGQVSAPKLVHMQASPPLNRLPSGTAPLSSATMAKSVSQALSLPSPQASPEIPRARRVKSGGVASAFAFFRRGSAKT